MATYVGTAGNNVITIAQGGQSLNWDGAGGTDTLSFERLVQSSFTINAPDANGYTVVDSVAGASAYYHIQLKNVELLAFRDGTLNLTTLFPSDTSAPTVATFSPADATTGVAIAGDIVVTFSEAIQRGAGNIVIKNAVGTVVETFSAATSANLTISGSVLTINPTASLGYNGAYSVEFVAGSVKDSAGNSFAGTTTYNFTTVAPPSGTSGNDMLGGGASDDTLDGGAGIDTAVFSGNFSAYTLTKSGNTYTVQANIGTDGTDTVTNIERLQFADTKLALDLGGNAGTTAKILGTVFGAASMANKQYVGIGLSLLDGGMSGSELMQLALNAKLGAGFSHEAEINLLYQNLAGVSPSTDDLNYWTGVLDSGQFSQASLALMAADLVGLNQTGIEYS